MLARGPSCPGPSGLLRDAIEDLPAPDLKTVMGLTVANRVQAAVDSGTLKAKRTRFALDGKDRAGEAWERVRDPVVESLRWVTDTGMEIAVEAGRWVAGVLGVDLAALEAEAREEIEDPKWWAA